ncbi:MAG: nucleotidyltransferase domain-containing protein [Campylobacter sp.]|nr:nucleotidyltransferase domain-containing protein [Campylobacter sp.]
MSRLPRNIEKELIGILKSIKPREIWLFGSYSKGTPTASSDIDIVVVKKKVGKKLHDRVVTLRNELNKFSQKYNIEVDLFIDTKDGINQKIENADPFYISAFESAIKIYEKKKDRKAQMPMFNKFQTLKIRIENLLKKD